MILHVQVARQFLYSSITTPVSTNAIRNQRQTSAHNSSSLFSDSHILIPIIGSTVGWAESGFPQEPRDQLCGAAWFFFFFFAIQRGRSCTENPDLTSGSRTDGIWWVCVRVRVVSSGGRREEVMWGELMMMRCSHYAAHCSSFSYHFPVSIFFSANKLERIREKLS